MGDSEEATKLSRSDEIRRFFTGEVTRALEVGPLSSPVLTDPQRVRYVDHCSREELHKKYAGHGPQFLARIPTVDFIWTGSRELPDNLKAYAPVDLVVGSHLIEHVPDFVGWLQTIEEMLSENGVLSLAVPDRRQTFDYHRPESTMGDVLEAFYTRRSKPSLRHVIDQRHYAVRYQERNSWPEPVGSNELKRVFPDPGTVHEFIDRWQRGGLHR